MWYLTSKKTGQIFYLLFSKEKYTVSRSAGDLILVNDTSISRTHACLQLNTDNTITVIDCNAKYGTYVNENIEMKKKLEPNVPYLLKQNDRVQFGLMGNEWKISKMNICVLPSTLNTEKIDLLTKKVKLLSGKLTNIWSEECTHLVMSTITITIKLLVALVSSTPIVTPKYFSDLIKAVEMEQQSLPVEESYIPDIEEPYLYKEKISFKPNKQRKTIFTNKTFIFLNQKQFEKYEMIIKAGGGQCQPAAKTKLTKSLLSKPEVLIVEYETQTESQYSQSVNKISEIICKQGRRLIPDSEIGLAILYCSTDKFCNSEYDFVPKFDALTNNEKESIDYTNIISIDTPVNNEAKKTINLSYVEIPETEALSKIDVLTPFINLTENDDDDFAVVEVPEKTKRVTRSSGSSSVLNNPLPTKTNKRKNTRKVESEVLSDENVNKKRKIASDKIDEEILSNDNDKVPIEQTKIILNNANIINKNDPGNKRKKSLERQTSNKKTRIALETEENLKNSEVPLVISDVEVHAPVLTPVFAKPNVPVKPFTSIFGKFNKTKKSQVDDEDDLFQFEESQSKRVTTEPINTKENLMENTQNVTQGLYSGQSSFMPSSALNNKCSIVEEPKYKIEPVDISLHGGWLSKFNQMNIEDDKKLIQPKDEETVEWIKSIRNAFEVKSVKVLSRSVTIDEHNSTKTNKNGNNSKNFKAFVKKNNFIPQTRIIKTFPMPQANQTII